MALPATAGPQAVSPLRAWGLGALATAGPQVVSPLRARGLGALPSTLSLSFQTAPSALLGGWGGYFYLDCFYFRVPGIGLRCCVEHQWVCPSQEISCAETKKKAPGKEWEAPPPRPGG